MTKMRWKDDYEVGIRIFDTQHKAIFSVINMLDDLVENGRAQSEIDELLLKLFYLGNEHILTEEHYFRKYDYPESEPHSNMHRDYMYKLNELMHERDKSKQSAEVLDYMRSWWFEHVQSIDKNYTKFFNRKGIY